MRQPVTRPCRNKASGRCKPAGNSQKPGGSRPGFTLVEMLVSAALIVLVMLMFAEVYRVAGDSVGRQKGITENDQRSRTLTTIINNDIAARTFRVVQSFHPAEDLSVVTPINDPTLRVGYLYISENDPIYQGDDVLQFTVNLWGANVQGAAENQPLSGRATKFDQPPLDALVLPANYDDPNQPEADDGQIDFSAAPPPVVNNHTGNSPVAEISYFLRNGNLIRRVMLIRRTYSDTPPSAAGSVQPASFPVGDYPAASSFWNDFDYSAFYLGGSGPQFHNYNYPAGDFDNVDPAVTTSFGMPHFRFGHDRTTGNPREYSNQPALAFIGRFTQQETSDPMFGYPGRIPDLDGVAGTESPLDPATNLGMFNGVVTYSAGVNGLWDNIDDLQFQGARRGEDILMTHVHSFDVKVFDQTYDETVLASDANQNGRIDAVADGGAFADVSHAAAGDYSQANYRHAAGFYGPNGPAGNRIFDTWHHLLDFDNADFGAPGGEDPPPFWPNSTGGIADPDPPLNTIIGRPLRAIQITIRFFDVASGQMRQLTLVESLVD